MAPRGSTFDTPGFPCRFCGADVKRLFADLGMTPLVNTQISRAGYNRPESYYPLQAYVCDRCLLVQLRDCITSGDVFNESYPYFSSYSSTWLEHARRYVDRMVEELNLDGGSLVVEIASNDGYLLQYFDPHGVNVLGVEPCRSVAEACIARGIPTEIAFFGETLARRLASEQGRADLLIGNNVLAHVPEIRDFVRGLAALLAPQGVVTMEFPHLLNLIRFNQFDTIYHEHFSYLSLHAVGAIFQDVGLELFDVERLPTHGGSLRIFAQGPQGRRAVTPRVEDVLAEERREGLLETATYDGFVERARATKFAILEFLIEAKRAGKRIAGYGAPGKGNTLLNYCGIGTDLVDFTVDANPAKQFTFTPGSRLPIFPPEHIAEAKPDILLILPWNLREEIMRETAYIRDWGGQWVTPIPEVRTWTDVQSLMAPEANGQPLHQARPSG